MTAPRRPRSAWLLVGSTPGTLAKVHSAGQRFSRFLAKVRWRRLRALFPAASSSSARSSALSGSMRAPRRAHRPAQGRAPSAARGGGGKERPQPPPPHLREEPAEALAGAVELRECARGRAHQQPRGARPARGGHLPQALLGQPIRTRRAHDRAAPLRLGYLSAAAALPLCLPRRCAHCRSARRPHPAAQLIQRGDLNAYDKCPLCWENVSCDTSQTPIEKGTCPMRSSHSLERLSVDFSDAHAGLLLPATLAERLGLKELLDEHVDLGRAPGAASPGVKALTLIYSALAGGDCIDDAAALRAGATAAVLGGELRAPSTLGTFLRSFTFGHARQLDVVSRRLLARAWGSGAGPG